MAKPSLKRMIVDDAGLQFPQGALVINVARMEDRVEPGRGGDHAMRQPIDLTHGLAESLRRNGMPVYNLKAGKSAAIWRAMFLARLLRRDHPVLRIRDLSAAATLPWLKK
jgi:hypothetical protein